MKERLINNLGLKILSILLAFFVWLVVVNVSNPDVTRTKEVLLEIENEQVLLAANRTYELSSGKNTVTVTYSVRTRDEYKVKAADFRAYIDLAELYDVTGSVPIKVEVLNNKEIIQDAAARPGVASVVTEELQKKKFDLKFMIGGEPAEDYAVNSTTASPEFVYVQGPVSQVGLISTVGLYVDVTGASEDMIGKTAPVFYNANGNVINLNDRVNVDVSEVDYTIGISKVKRLNIDFEVAGTAAAGYQYAGVESDTRTISVIGLKTNLASINKITIPASVLNVDGATEDKVVRVDLRNYLPEGVELADTENAVIDIRLKVELLETKVFRLQVGDIMKTGASDAYDYRIKPRQIEVTMQGLGEDLNGLQLSDLGIRMNVTGLQLGTHKGALTFNHNEVFTVLSYTDFEVEVIEKIEPGAETDPEESGESGSAATSHAAEESSESSGHTTAAETTASGVYTPETTVPAETNINTDTSEE
ncbi:MAG: CdaR family protein [Lachnospiraceae bacterium]